MMRFKQQLIIALLVFISLSYTGCFRRPYQATSRPPVPDEIDYAVMRAVLDNLYADTEFNLCHVNPIGRVAFALHTPTTNRLEDVVISTLGPDSQKWLGVRIHEDILNEFNNRNSRAAKFSGFTANSTNIVVLPNRKDISWGLITGTEDMPSDCRGGIASYLPAYSADMKTAIVVFICFPNYHNSPTGTYYLKKEDDGWVVHAGKIWEYM